MDSATWTNQIARTVRETFNFVSKIENEKICKNKNFNIFHINSSPDLTPLDCFLWSHLKKIIYEQEPASPEEIIAKMQIAVQTIDRSMLRRMRENLILRAEACVEARGGHFENLI